VRFAWVKNGVNLCAYQLQGHLEVFTGHSKFSDISAIRKISKSHKVDRHTQEAGTYHNNRISKCPAFATHDKKNGCSKDNSKWRPIIE
jgi:hypothetical protein